MPLQQELPQQYHVHIKATDLKNFDAEETEYFLRSMSVRYPDLEFDYQHHMHTIKGVINEDNLEDFGRTIQQISNAGAVLIKESIVQVGTGIKIVNN